MEGTLDIWEGYFSGWKSLFVTLFNNHLILSDHKGGNLKGKIPLTDIRIEPKSERDTKFNLYTGLQTWELNARDIRDKVRWLNAM